MNVIYTGPGLLNYQPWQLEFLWVQWFGLIEQSLGCCDLTLDALHFIPMTEDDMFGFVDPADVV